MTTVRKIFGCRKWR